MNIKSFLLNCFCLISIGQSLNCCGQDRPNILFAILDDATYQHFGVYGCSWVKTPNFDKIAKQGVLFTRAYTPNAKCGPSRASILTSRNSWQLEEAANHWAVFPNKFKTFMEVLSEKGYHVGYTGKGWAPGIPGKIKGKKRMLTGKRYNDAKLSPPTKAISDIDYVSNFNKFLDKNNQKKPFCFWFGAKEPHRKYEYGSGIAKGGKKLSQLDKEVYSFWPDNRKIRTDILDYAYEIEYFDYQLGKILDELEKRNLLSNTIVVVTSDNGMPFPRIKGQEYELSNHMPLAIMWLDQIKYPNRVVDDFVSFIDFAPSFLQFDVISETNSGMLPIEGRSLTTLLLTSKSGSIDSSRNFVLIGKERHDVGRPNDWGYPIRGIVKGNYLYLQNFEPTRWPAGNPETGYLNCDGSPTKTNILSLKEKGLNSSYWKNSFGKRSGDEMYNIKQDPQCMKNLAENQKLKFIVDSLKQELVFKLKKQGDPRMFGNGEVFDAYKYGNSSRANFYNRVIHHQEKIDAGWVNPTDFKKKKKPY